MGDVDVALIDAGGANLGSVRHALARLGVTPRIVADADVLGQPNRIILPGVGAAAAAMRLLDQRGLTAALRANRVPLFGICLGMQLLFEHSDEGDVDCLGLIVGRVRALSPAPGIRIPHMGWNRIETLCASPLLADVTDGGQAYFVHGYAAPVTPDCIASVQHGQSFAAMVRAGHVAGAQFHPERSSTLGARILANFLRWQP